MSQLIHSQTIREKMKEDLDNNKLPRSEVRKLMEKRIKNYEKIKEKGFR